MWCGKSLLLLSFVCIAFHFTTIEAYNRPTAKCNVLSTALADIFDNNDNANNQRCSNPNEFNQNRFFTRTGPTNWDPGCTCENNADCGNLGFPDHFRCCIVSGKTTGICYDNSQYSCCQYEYGQRSNATNPPPLTKAAVLHPVPVADTAPKCCAWSENMIFNERVGNGGAREYDNWPSAFATTLSDGDCGCFDDTDCTETKTGTANQVCCSMSVGGAKRCRPKAECCTFSRDNADPTNTADRKFELLKLWFNPETHLCCPYGGVKRYIAADGRIAVSYHGTPADVGFYLFAVKGGGADGAYRCQCVPSSGSSDGPAQLGRPGSGDEFVNYGCRGSETCCGISKDDGNKYWEALGKSANSLLWRENQCNPANPGCLDTCLGMCAAPDMCTDACGRALMIPSGALSTAYLQSKPAEWECCSWSVKQDRITHASELPTGNSGAEDSATTAKIEEWGTRFGVYRPKKQYCCEDGIVGISAAWTGGGTCGCSDANPCPAAGEGLPELQCCGGKCYNPQNLQCCGGQLVDWETYCCETPQATDAKRAPHMWASAADRRGNEGDAKAQCPCAEDADCSGGIKFNGDAAPGTWACCKAPDAALGYCYDQAEEQCCTSGPYSLYCDIGEDANGFPSKQFVIGKNRKALSTRTGTPLAHVCCKINGPIKGWSTKGSGGSVNWQASAKTADPINGCICKIDEDCQIGDDGDDYVCCKDKNMDKEDHGCSAQEFLFKNDFTATNSHCSGRCINKKFQSCCGGEVCYSKWQKCCGEDTDAPICCNKFSESCKVGKDDRFLIEDDKEKAVCAKDESKNASIIFVAYVFPALLALFLILVFILGVRGAMWNPADSMWAIVLVVLGIIILVLSILMLFSPLWKYSVVCVCAVAAILSGMSNKAGPGTVRLGTIIGIVSVLFVMDPFVGNAALSMHYYIGPGGARGTVSGTLGSAELTEGAVHTAFRLYKKTCMHYYDYFKREQASAGAQVWADTRDFREDNPEMVQFGLCAPGWVHAIVIISGLLVCFQILFVVIGLLAMVFCRERDPRVSPES